MTKDNHNDDLKFLYDKVYDELNRSRDWPIKVIAFVSTLYIAFLGFIKIGKNDIQLCLSTKLVIIAGMLLITIYALVIIVRQHKNYLKYRNVQIGLQNSLRIHEWNIDGTPIFPEEWKNKIEPKMWKNWWGWGFYALYLIILTAMSSFLLLAQS